MHALQPAPGHIWIGEFSPALTPAHLERFARRDERLLLRRRAASMFFTEEREGEAQTYICYLNAAMVAGTTSFVADGPVSSSRVGQKHEQVHFIPAEESTGGAK